MLSITFYPTTILKECQKDHSYVEYITRFLWNLHIGIKLLMDFDNLLLYMLADLG
mgnify:CR=1 FL=1